MVGMTRTDVASPMSHPYESSSIEERLTKNEQSTHRLRNIQSPTLLQRGHRTNDLIGIRSLQDEILVKIFFGDIERHGEIKLSSFGVLTKRSDICIRAYGDIPIATPELVIAFISSQTTSLALLGLKQIPLVASWTKSERRDILPLHCNTRYLYSSSSVILTDTGKSSTMRSTSQSSLRTTLVLPT